MLDKIVNSKSKTFMAFCFCFLVGIFLASILNRKIDFVYLYFLIFTLTGFVYIYKNNKKILFYFISLLIFILGVARYNFSIPEYQKDIGKNKTFQAVIADEPDIRYDGVRYIVKSAAISEKIYIKSELYPRFKYGDELNIQCDLKKPESFDDFRYDMYLASKGVFYVCFNPSINKTGENGNIFYKYIYGLKNILADRINILYHEPQASFMAGLLYGYRGGLGDLQEDFNRTGISHIVAISGYNIAIIATILMTLCIHLWIPRKKAFWLVSIGILLFVLFVGASGSVVRAGIMGFLVLFAKQIGRMNRVGNAMLLTAVVMCLFNPYILVWDVGFQLSFLSMIGLVYFAPILEKIFIKIPEFFGLKESLISTLSAIIGTLPLMLYQFGSISIVAPIVNILVLWIIPLIMIIGFFSIILSFIFYPLGEVLSWIAWVFMQYIIVIVKWFSSLSFASINMSVPFLVSVLMYGILWYVIKKYNHDEII